MSRVDRSALDRAGWQILHRALEPARVDRLRQAFTTPDGSGTEHVSISDATPAADEWRALADHPLLVAAATHVLGDTFHVRDVHGRNPRPGHGQQGLHADWQPLVPGVPFMVLTALWLLDDFTVDNGATRLVPGSHLFHGGVPRPDAQPHAHHPDERIVTGPAGSLLLINGHLWHSGRKNRSNGPRRAVQMIVMRGER